MDIASALGATPPAPQKKEQATAPAPSDGDASASSSFEDEFESASATTASPAEKKPTETMETETPPDGAAADGALLIDAEASASTEEIRAAVVEEIQETAEEPPAILPSPDGEATPVEEILLETAPEIAASAGKPVEIESARPLEEPESDDATGEGAIETALAPTPIANSVAIAAPPMIPAAEINATLETASAPAVEALATAPEEPVQTPIIPEAREKPWAPAAADKLQAYTRNAQDISVEASLAAMRAIEIHGAPHKTETHAATAADGASIAGQVIAAIRADRSAGSVEVRLDPPELGRVRIHFNMERADIVVATVTSERGETLDLLRRHSADLVRELERAGFASVQLDFAAGDNRAFAGWDQPERADYGLLPEGMADEQIVTFVRKAQGRLDRFV